MKPVTIWFNKYLSNTWEILAALREARLPEEFRVLCTHPNRRYPGQQHSDVFEREPWGLGQSEYVNYCLDVARRHEVDLFLPGRKLLAIVRARQRFEALGVRVLAAADADTLDLLASKARVYAALQTEDIPLPDYEVVNDLAGFDAAWARMRPRHLLLCYKPAVSVYGIGFHIVADRGPALERLRAGDPVHIRYEDARHKLADKGRFGDLLVMQYLPGPERSVDVLARDGELIRCVVRRKEDQAQVLEDNPELVATVRRLTARFRLTNLFNVQFRDAGGRSYLLEINPRMSGGLPFACRSGLVLPYWAIRLALGSATPEEVPEPRTGIRIPQPEPVSSL
jgi:hypothetical protein